MIRKTVDQTFDGQKNYIEAYGVSTDAKPDGGIITGSVFIEVDTGNVYLFNEDAGTGGEWVNIGGDSAASEEVG